MAETPRVRVVSSVANVRADASIQGSVLFQLKRGEEVVLLGEVGDWYHIQTSNGWQGYVKKDLVAVVGAPAPPSPAAPPATATPVAPAAQASAGGPAIDHRPLDCVLADNFPRLDARFDPPDVKRARVFFRAGGTVYWYFVDMSAEAGAYQGILPKPKLATKKIDYYVEAFGQGLVSGRTQEYGPAVVSRKADCSSRMMAGIATPAGKLVVGSTAADAPAVPEGFDAAGIGVTSAASAAAVAQASSTGAAAGSTAAAGSHTLLFVAGGVVAAGGIALAAKGGGSSSSPPAPIDLSGTWTGPLSGQITSAGGPASVTCQTTETVTMHISQSGNAISGNGTGTTTHFSCNLPGFTGGAPGFSGAGGSGSAPFTGTASGGQLTFSLPNGVVFTGTYTSGTFTTTYHGVASQQGVTVTQDGTMTLTRQ